MNVESQDYYTSRISDPFLNDQMSQEELDDEGFGLHKYDLIIETIGDDENQINIKLYLDDVLNNLSDQDREIFCNKCLDKLIEVYELNAIDNEKNLLNLKDNFNSYIINLLKFIESYQLISILSKCLPYVALEIMRSKENLKKFLNINYKSFLMNLNKYRSEVPYLLKRQFLYCSKSDGINLLIKLIQKDSLSIHVNQITKGNGNDNNHEVENEVSI